MLRTGLLLATLVLTTCGTCLPQMGMPPPKRCSLRVTVTYDDGVTRVRNASVELENPLGGGSALDQKQTDPDGQVEFDTFSGAHRIRIIGDDFYPYEGELDINRGETSHQETLRVRRKKPADASSPQGSGTVPTIRLKIPDAAKREFDRGSEALGQQQWESSRKHFQAAIELYPDYDMAYNGLGSAAWQLNDVAGARAAFLKATQLNPDYAEAQRNLGRILLRERDYVELAAHLERSLKVEPTNTWALAYAAFAELQTGRFPEAVDHARKVHSLPHEKMAWVHMVAGYALEALGQKQEAAVEFKIYLKEDPKGSDAKHAKDGLARLTNLPQP